MRKNFSLLALAIVVIVGMTATTAAGSFLCSDVNADGTVDISDAVYLIAYIFSGGSAPQPLLAGDANHDGMVDISDVVYLIAYIFSGGPAPDCQRYTTPSTTTIIPQDSGAAIMSYDTAGTIVLGESSSYAQGVAVGDVIIGQNDAQAPNGFLRKVTSKTTQGGSIVLGTEPATMMQAFESMDISETHQLKPSDVKSVKLQRGVTFRAAPDDETFIVPISCVLHDQDGDPETTGDQIRIDGEYRFSAALFAVIEMDWFTLKKFETGIETNENANIHLTAGVQWVFADESKKIAEFAFAAIPVGGVVWLVPTLNIKAHINGDLTVTLETDITYTQELRYGLGYANGTYYDISQSTKDFTYSPPQLTLAFNFEPGLSLNVACLLYGVAGPYMGGKLGLPFQAALSADPCALDLTFTLDAVLYAVVGIECDILDLDSTMDFQLYTYPIGEWIYPLSGSGTIVIDAEPNNLNAPWSLAGTCSYDTTGNGDDTLTNLDPGDYTIAWETVLGWTAPSSSTQNLAAGKTLTLGGTYVQNVVPVLTTAAVSAITQTTAQSGGNITSDGGSAVTARGVCWSMSPTPTIADDTTVNGSGTGSFTSSITGLTASTPYYVRAYATNSAGTGYGNEVSFTTSSSSGTVTDIDGNIYQTVTIGTQVWMMENLKVTHYRNGDAIPNVTDNTTWAGLSTGAYCEYNNDANSVATYGRLYNWYSANDSRNIAPAGWHVPTDAEWKELEMYLGMSQAQADASGLRGTDEGGKLKEAGTTHWNPPNTDATNESGFFALPGGYRASGGNFLSMGYYAAFWSSTENGSNYAWNRYVIYNYSQVLRFDYSSKPYGFSVRCVRD